VWRHTPRRLDAEEVRDAMLASAGTLDRRRPAGSPAMSLKMIEMRDNGPEARALREQADRGRHRSVYLPLLRGVTPHALEAVDPARAYLAQYESAAREVLAASPPVKPKVAAPGPAKKPAAQPANPDEIDQTGEPVVEDAVRPKDARSAAWLSFVQALFGSAE